MAFTTFSVTYNLPQNRLQLSFTLLLTAVTFKWVVVRCLPTISYLTTLVKRSRHPPSHVIRLICRLGQIRSSLHGDALCRVRLACDHRHVSDGCCTSLGQYRIYIISCYLHVVSRLLLPLDVLCCEYKSIFHSLRRSLSLSLSLSLSIRRIDDDG